MASGFFLGGMAQGIESAQKQGLAERTLGADTGLRTRALDIQQQAADRLSHAAQQTEIDKYLASSTELIKETIEKFVAGGVDLQSPAAQKRISELVAGTVPLVVKAGRDPNLFIAGVRAQMAAPASTAVAGTKGTAEGTQVAAKVKALSGGNVQIPPGVGDPEAYLKKQATEEAEIQAKAPEAAGKVIETMSGLDRLGAQAKMIKDDPALKRVTGLTGAFPSVPGTPAADLEAKIESLVSQTGFGTLAAMREASKSGGALGQISDKEIILLQNALAGLKQKQSTEAYQKSLQQIIDFTDGAKGRMADGYKNTYGKKLGDASRSPSTSTAEGKRPLSELVEILRSDQTKRKEFDVRFGAGAAAKLLGQ